MNTKSTKVFQELIVNQRSQCDTTKKLNMNDMRRISLRLTNSIFDTSNCSVWNSYNSNVSKNTSYINFYFRNKKMALHRLLYFNYVDDLNKDQYIKFKCKNKGRCCNINHMYLVSDSKKNLDISENKIKKKEKNLIVNFN